MQSDEFHRRLPCPGNEYAKWYRMTTGGGHHKRRGRGGDDANVSLGTYPKVFGYVLVEFIVVVDAATAAVQICSRDDDVDGRGYLDCPSAIYIATLDEGRRRWQAL
jgi:hypothetical protein